MLPKLCYISDLYAAINSDSLGNSAKLELLKYHHGTG
jgi:hypothetical protein